MVISCQNKKQEITFTVNTHTYYIHANNYVWSIDTYIDYRILSLLPTLLNALHYSSKTDHRRLVGGTVYYILALEFKTSP